MRKITSLLENRILGPIIMTSNDFDNYQNLVKSEIDKIYSEKVTIDNMIFVAKQSFDSPQRLKSIINYANSNINLCEWIVKKFECISIVDLFNTIREESLNLFSPEGKYFQTVLEKLTNTEAIGIRNEEFAAKYLQDFLAQKQINTKVKRTETDCGDDLLRGIDLYFDYNGKKITSQVKPLKDIKISDEKIEILSSGKLKPYSVHYLLFVNLKENKVIMFRNKNVTYDNKTVYINTDSLINKNF